MPIIWPVMLFVQGRGGWLRRTFTTMGHEEQLLLEPVCIE